MAFDSDSMLKWFGIAILVLAVGFFLFRAGKLLWGSIGTVRKVYQTSMAAPRRSDLPYSFQFSRQPGSVRGS